MPWSGVQVPPRLPPEKANAMIVHLNGLPGVGKYTTAKILVGLLPKARLIDNHALINAAYVCGGEHGSPEYMALLEKLVDLVYTELEKRPSDEIMVFTNALAADCPIDGPRFDRVVALAKARNDMFVPVRLTCTIEENVRRGITPERAQKQKLIKPDILQALAEKHTVLHPSDHPYQLDIDTTALQAEDVAQQIAEHIQKNL